MTTKEDFISNLEFDYVFVTYVANNNIALGLLACLHTFTYAVWYAHLPKQKCCSPRNSQFVIVTGSWYVVAFSRQTVEGGRIRRFSVI